MFPLAEWTKPSHEAQMFEFCNECIVIFSIFNAFHLDWNCFFAVFDVFFPIATINMEFNFACWVLRIWGIRFRCLHCCFLVVTPRRKGCGKGAVVGFCSDKSVYDWCIRMDIFRKWMNMNWMDSILDFSGKSVKELVEFGIWEHVEVRYSGYFRFIPVQVEVFEVCKSSWMCSGSILFKGILFQNWS